MFNQYIKTTRIFINTKYNNKTFINKSNGKYGYIKVVYINNNKSEVEIMCPIHGVFSQVAGEHLNGSGCPKCNESKGEQLVVSYLDSKNIKYAQEYKLSDTRFRYDFYLTELNILIEYDGIQHFKPISIFGGQRGFVETRERDKLKNILASINQIPVIRIPYTRHTALDKYLDNKIKLRKKYG